MPSVSQKTPGPLARAIATVLHDEFKRQGISQTTLAARAGMTQSRVSVFIRGKRTLDVDQLQSLCDALGLSIRGVIHSAEGLLEG